MASHIEQQPTTDIKDVLEVTEALFGIRHRAATPVALVWTFRGRLHCHFTTAREYVRDKTFGRLLGAFDDWLAVALGDVE